MNSKLRASRLLLGFFLLSGLLLRILFALYGAKVYYASQLFVNLNGDSQSYIRSFEHLLHDGTYSFDFLAPDAAFGRLPGYPFFYGIHYLVFGPENAIGATIGSQLLLDTGGILLAFGILRRAQPHAVVAPYIAAAFYAFYPFIIIWLPIIGTESLGTFLTLAWLYCLLGFRPSLAYAIGFGMLLALIFYVREYLGILMPISLVYLVVKHRAQLRGAAMSAVAWPWRRSIIMVSLVFGLLYSIWPVRNYVFQHRFMLIKTPTAGYVNYGPDMHSYRTWLQCWTNDESPWIEQALQTSTIAFPTEVFADAREQAEAQRLIGLARQCGRSFFFMRTNFSASIEYQDTAAMHHNARLQAVNQRDCSAEISAGFAHLRQSYWQRKPLQYCFAVPLQNLQKAFFKSGTAKVKGEPLNGRVLALRILFGYRTLLLLLAVAGLWRFRRQTAFLPIILFSGFMYFFVSFLVRSMEMRYLLQADVLLLIPAAALLGHMVERWVLSRFPSALAPR